MAATVGPVAVVWAGVRPKEPRIMVAVVVGVAFEPATMAASEPGMARTL